MTRSLVRAPLQIGYVTIFGYAVLIIFLIPVQGVFARQFGRIRKITVGIRDRRVRILSDIILGMQVCCVLGRSISSPKEQCECS